MRGFGKAHNEEIEICRGALMAVIVTAVSDDMVEKVTGAIREYANTGAAGIAGCCKRV